ncbi:unnamed protein product [Candidula unifasciata]|uniref:MD-2-related lipid-recognition domain-containing protein n=1 Tax=Candidula unifasciata TaxID=100452 RepID=A0A8S3YGR6_9EUPU|nr:unnamed protein product [Candidula unifasciata]
MFASDFVIFASFGVLCTLALSVRDGENVKRMQVLKYNSKTNRNNINIKQVVESQSAVNDSQLYSHKNVPLLQFMRDNFKALSWNTKTQVNSFIWKNCGSSSDLLVVNALSVTPDPVSLPGTIGLKFDVTIQETFTAPLKLAVVLKKYEEFFWLTIPCIDDMGSCTYDDICPKLAKITCPKQFGTTIPCKCPFTKGRYSLPSSSFTVPVHVPAGKYLVQARLSYGSKAVNCIEITSTLLRWQ